MGRTVHDIYENAVPQLKFQTYFHSPQRRIVLWSSSLSLEFSAPWRIENDDDAIAKDLDLVKLVKNLQPFKARAFESRNSLFLQAIKINAKIIPRFQQYEGANKIVESKKR